MIEKDTPYRIVDLLKADVLTGQRGADKVVPSSEFKGALITDFSHLKMSWVRRFFDSRRHRSRRRLVVRGRGIAVETLVRSHVVELVDKASKAFLLGFHVSFSGQGCFLLQGKMHAFVAAILLGLTWSNTLMADAEFEPPHTEQREAKHTVAGEGNPIVGSDGLWQTVVGKKTFEDRFSPGTPSRSKSLAGQQISTTGIGNGKWIAIGPVEEAEFSFEVGRPDLVGTIHLQRWSRRMRRSSTTTTGLAQTMSLQDLPNSTFSWPRNVGFSPAEVVKEFAWPPTRVSLTHGDDAFFDRDRRSMRTGMRSPTYIIQCLKPSFVIAADPLVTGFSADAEPLTQLSHRIEAILVGQDKASSFIHRVGMEPRHDNTSFVSNDAAKKVLPMYPAKSVTYVPG